MDTFVFKSLRNENGIRLVQWGGLKDGFFLISEETGESCKEFVLRVLHGVQDSKNSELKRFGGENEGVFGVEYEKEAHEFFDYVVEGKKQMAEIKLLERIIEKREKEIESLCMEIEILQGQIAHTFPAWAVGR